jgi:enoyl-CoA hydratase/carnithine racemase
MATMTSTDLVLAERRGPVLVLTLNRPERLNAWTDALEERYYARLDEAEHDPEVRAIVVTGAGRGFCAGADLGDLELGAFTEAAADAALRDRPRPRTYPLTIRKPIIAAINGAAAGLGQVEALYPDVQEAVRSHLEKRTAKFPPLDARSPDA